MKVGSLTASYGDNFTIFITDFVDTGDRISNQKTKDLLELQMAGNHLSLPQQISFEYGIKDGNTLKRTNIVNSKKFKQGELFLFDVLAGQTSVFSIYIWDGQIETRFMFFHDFALFNGVLGRFGVKKNFEKLNI